MRKTGILVGALCGALTTAALVAILFLAYGLAGLPFVPFQLFDRAARTLPGSVIGTTRWTGVSPRRVLDDVGLQPGATHLRIHSVDGFFEVVPLEVVRTDERVMLTYAWDGLPLARPHGFPLRIYGWIG